MSYIITKQLKNTGVAIFLTILFGGIGLFYASILGGIIMTIIFPVLIFFLFFTGHFFASIAFACSYYIVCMIWAITGVKSYNKKITKESLMNIAPINNTQSSYNNGPNSNNDNYYDNYRKSMASDNTVTWIFVVIFIGGILFYVTYKLIE